MYNFFLPSFGFSGRNKGEVVVEGKQMGAMAPVASKNYFLAYPLCSVCVGRQKALCPFFETYSFKIVTIVNRIFKFKK